MIHFHCPQCGGKVRVPEKFGGKKGRCPTCKAVMDIPAASADASADTAAASASADTTAAPEAPPEDPLASLAAAAASTAAPAPPKPAPAPKPAPVERPETPPIPAAPEVVVDTEIVGAAGIPAPAPAPFPAMEALAAAEPAVEALAAAVPVGESRAAAAPAAAPAALGRAEQAAQRNAVVLFGLFLLCLVFWLAYAAVVLVPLPHALRMLPDILLVLLGVFTLGGSALGLAYVPGRWGVLSRLPVTYRILAGVGAVGLVLLLILTANLLPTALQFSRPQP